MPLYQLLCSLCSDHCNSITLHPAQVTSHHPSCFQPDTHKLTSATYHTLTISTLVCFCSCPTMGKDFNYPECITKAKILLRPTKSHHFIKDSNGVHLTEAKLNLKSGPIKVLFLSTEDPLWPTGLADGYSSTSPNFLVTHLSAILISWAHFLLFMLTLRPCAERRSE